MEALGDDTLRTIAVMRLEWHKAGEIARRLAISPRSVERKLQLIRQIWEQIAAGEPCGRVVGPAGPYENARQNHLIGDFDSDVTAVDQASERSNGRLILRSL